MPNRLKVSFRLGKSYKKTLQAVNNQELYKRYGKQLHLRIGKLTIITENGPDWIWCPNGTDAVAYDCSSKMTKVVYTI